MEQKIVTRVVINSNDKEKNYINELNEFYNLDLKPNEFYNSKDLKIGDTFEFKGENLKVNNIRIKIEPEFIKMQPDTDGVPNGFSCQIYLDCNKV